MTTNKKPSDYIGQHFQVQNCEAKRHGDNVGCVCSLIGQTVTISGVHDSPFSGPVFFLIEGHDKRIRLSEVGEPNLYQ
jgi:hypothetical protein